MQADDPEDPHFGGVNLETRRARAKLRQRPLQLGEVSGAFGRIHEARSMGEANAGGEALFEAGVAGGAGK